MNLKEKQYIVDNWDNEKTSKVFNSILNHAKSSFIYNIMAPTPCPSYTDELMMIDVIQDSIKEANEVGHQ